MSLPASRRPGSSFPEDEEATSIQSILATRPLAGFFPSNHSPQGVSSGLSWEIRLSGDLVFQAALVWPFQAGPGAGEGLWAGLAALGLGLQARLPHTHTPGFSLDIPGTTCPGCWARGPSHLRHLLSPPEGWEAEPSGQKEGRMQGSRVTPQPLGPPQRGLLGRPSAQCAVQSLDVGTVPLATLPPSRRSTEWLLA